MADIFELKTVLNHIEKLLEEELAHLNSEWEKELREEWDITPEDLLDPDNLRAQLIKMGAGGYSIQSSYLRFSFSNIVRKSLFLSAYNFLEALLNWGCNFREEKWNLNISLNDLNGKGVNRARKYLIKVMNIGFPDAPHWQEIQNYNKLRNCIVHNDGKLVGTSDEEVLKKYIENNSYLKIDFGEVFIERGFCENVFETIEKFSKQLDDSILEKEIEKDSQA